VCIKGTISNKTTTIKLPTSQ